MLMPTRKFSCLPVATLAILTFTLITLSNSMAAQDGENIYFEFSTTGPIGYAPIAGITFDSGGEVWGATTLGGFNNVGTIFKINNAHGGAGAMPSQFTPSSAAPKTAPILGASTTRDRQ
jgi:hypothetical protein